MRPSSSEKMRMRKLRSEYRRRIAIAAIVCLLIGLLLGVLLERQLLNRREVTQNPGTGANVALTTTPAADGTEPDGTGEGDENPGQDPQGSGAGTLKLEPAGSDGGEGDSDNAIELATPTPTPAPTPTPEPTPVPGPTVIATVPFGESYTYSTQIKADGTARMEADDEPYETVSFTQTMVSYKRPADFAEKYASTYKLQGNEAGAGFELILNDYTGTAKIMPQSVVKIAFEDESGENEITGYQLMNKEISGDYNITLDTNKPTTLYKRYQYSNTGEEMKYLVVSTYVDGQIRKILFELESNVPEEPDPAELYQTLEKTAKSDAVKDMQLALIGLGYLEGDADGDFGSKTEAAIKAAQKAFEMEETGVADPAFQQRLFKEYPLDSGDSGTDQEAAETTAEATAEPQTESVG